MEGGSGEGGVSTKVGGWCGFWGGIFGLGMGEGGLWVIDGFSVWSSLWVGDLRMGGLVDKRMGVAFAGKGRGF